MNQRYHSEAIDSQDEAGCMPPLEGDSVLDHTPSTYPGSRLPHAWLNKAVPEKPISTIDLAGKGKFTVLTGIGGKAWKEAAADVAEALKVPIAAYSIGFRQDWEDPYFKWEELKEVEEDGCILVRPDRFIAWRSMEMQEDPKGALMKALRKILARNA